MVADCRCHRFNAYPWSPNLHQACLEHHYRSLQLSKLKTKRSYEVAYDKIIPLLKDTKLELNPPETVSSCQQQAHQKLRELRQSAKTKFQEFLSSLLMTATVTKTKIKNLIPGLKQAEEIIDASKWYGESSIHPHQEVLIPSQVNPTQWIPALTEKLWRSTSFSTAKPTSAKPMAPHSHNHSYQTFWDSIDSHHLANKSLMANLSHQN